MLEAALEYASRGWAVFPCVPGQKNPLTEHGFKDATTDEEQIREWWGQWPTANIGIATGERSSLWVLDIDPRNGGLSEWINIQNTVPEYTQPTNAVVRTGSGGVHYYFAYNIEHRFRKTLKSGIDIQGSGKYVLAPPSVTESEYVWESQGELLEAPQWLLELCKKPEYAPKKVVLGDSNQFDDRPGSRYNRTATIEELLEPRGWTKVDEDDSGESYWRRPGKTDGTHSATFNYAGTNLLYVFSSAAEPFEGDTAYSLFSAYTLLEHDGDYSKAASALNQVLPPPVVSVQESEYSFSNAFPEEHFITEYINYAGLQTDAPREYHEACGLGLAALCTPISRGNLAPYGGNLSTNLYAILVGSTTRSRKSTAQRIAQSLAKAVSPFSVLPNRATTEALIEAMSDRSNFATLWTPDEFGVQLAEIYRRDFLSGLEEMLLTLYGGDDYSYRRVKKNGLDNGTVTVTKPHLNILGAATPESLMRAGSTALESGLLPRFAVIYPKTLPEPRPVTLVNPDTESQYRALVSRLRAIQTYSKGIPHVTFTTGSLASLNAAEGILVGHGIHTARLPTMLYKVAMLSALSDLRDEVTDQDADAAVKVVMRWAEGVNNLRPMLSMRSVDVDFERSVQTALEVFKRHEPPVNRAIVARELRLSEDAFSRVERTLVGRAEINSAGGLWTRA